MAKQPKQPKQVQVLARYIHKTDGKPNGRISYLVRSSNGKDTYCTTLIDGKASGCSCPSKKPCYHMTQLEAKEAARTPIKAVAVKVAKSDESTSKQLIKSVDVAQKVESFKQSWGKPARQKEDWTESAPLNRQGYHLI